MSLTIATGSLPRAEITTAEPDWSRIAARLSLSPRELQVVKRALQGRRIGQIAEDLDLAVGTVKTYLARIRAKLGVKKRQHLTSTVLATALSRQ